MIVAGLGCVKGASTEDVLLAIEAALEAHGQSKAKLSSLATGPQKADEAGLIGAAEKLALPLRVASAEALAAASAHCLTQSAQSLAHSGLPSLCEAAALAAAGPDARLIGPRLVRNGVTCALALSGETT